MNNQDNLRVIIRKLVFLLFAFLICIFLVIFLIHFVYTVFSESKFYDVPLPFFYYLLVPVFWGGYFYLKFRKESKKTSSKFLVLINAIIPICMLLYSVVGSYELSKLSFPQPTLSDFIRNTIMIFNLLLISFALIYSVYILTMFLSKTSHSISDLVWIVSIFLFIIIIFTDIYLIIFSTNKESFTGIILTNKFALVVDFFYFSTITFTSLGYGDILPATPIAKLAASSEALLLVIGISIIILSVVRLKSKPIIEESSSN